MIGKHLGRMNAAAAVLLCIALTAAAAVTVEIKGKVTNPFSEEQSRAVTVIVTDRIGTELGRVHPDRQGQAQCLCGKT